MYSYLHIHHPKSTMHVGKHTNPMDPMGSYSSWTLNPCIFHHLLTVVFFPPNALPEKNLETAGGPVGSFKLSKAVRKSKGLEVAIRNSWVWRDFLKMRWLQKVPTFYSPNETVKHMWEKPWYLCKNYIRCFEGQNCSKSGFWRYKKSSWNLPFG